jgi:hypothetical protein
LDRSGNAPDSSAGVTQLNAKYIEKSSFSEGKRETDMNWDKGRRACKNKNQLRKL